MDEWIYFLTLCKEFQQSSLAVELFWIFFFNIVTDKLNDNLHFLVHLLTAP